MEEASDRKIEVTGSLLDAGRTEWHFKECYMFDRKSNIPFVGYEKVGEAFQEHEKRDDRKQYF